MVGGMGHTATTSLGLSIKNKENIICLDGDGSFIMHMGYCNSGNLRKKL